MSHPDPDEKIPASADEGGLGLNRRPHEYMLKETKGRHREMLPKWCKRIPFSEEWRPPRRRDVYVST